MGNAVAATLARQVGLMAELRVVANNVANAATTGYRTESVVFSEYVRDTGGPSLSMAAARAHVVGTAQGALQRTDGPMDLAIEGEGWFQVGTPDGPRLTRAGHFAQDAAGALVDPDGFPLLDAGGAPVALQPGGGAVSVAPDGTVSQDGRPVAQVGLVVPRDPLELRREGGQRFAAPSGADPAPEGRILQGFLEESNVDAVGEVARMIEVSRAYEMGQKFLDREDERVRGVVRALEVRR